MMASPPPHSPLSSCFMGILATSTCRSAIRRRGYKAEIPCPRSYPQKSECLILRWRSSPQTACPLTSFPKSVAFSPPSVPMHAKPSGLPGRRVSLRNTEERPATAGLPFCALARMCHPSSPLSRGSFVFVDIFL